MRQRISKLDNSLRILYLGTADFPGGGAAGRCMHMVSKGLVRLGHEVTVLMGMRRMTGPAEEIIDGIRIIWSSGEILAGDSGRFKRMALFVRSRLTYVCALWRLVGGARYDWIVCYAIGGELMIPAILASRKFKVRLAYQHGDRVDTDRWFSHNCAFILSAKVGQLMGVKYSDIVANSGSSRLALTFRGLSSTVPITTLLPPVDTGVFSEADSKSFRCQHNMNGLRLVTYAGGFKAFEGLEDLLRGLSSTLRNDMSVRLVLAGGEVQSELHHLQALALSLGFNSQVLFTGPLGLVEVANLLACSNVLVIPKRDHPANHYAMPIKLGEYFASAKPVVSAAIGGINDYLKHGVNGLLYPPGDLDAMRRCVEELLYDDEKAERIGLAGRKTAIEQFDMNVVASGFADTMERIVD